MEEEGRGGRGMEEVVAGRKWRSGGGRAREEGVVAKCATQGHV